MGGDSHHWSPRWFFWDGGFFAVGRTSGIVPPHAHHAIQITLAVEGALRIRGEAGEWQDCGGAIVRPDVIHSFDGNGMLGAMLFVDPESFEGQWLAASLTSDITLVPARRLEGCVVELRRFEASPLDALDPSALIRHCVQTLSVNAPPSRRLDPRVARVLASVRSADDLRLSLEDAAAMVFLSPGRFAHLFTEHVGLPFRRYMLWRKLTRALLSVSRGRSLAEAAHAADFADAAHFTRTCGQMFGIPPSILMQGEFFEIAAPFEHQSA